MKQITRIGALALLSFAVAPAAQAATQITTGAFGIYSTVRVVNTAGTTLAPVASVYGMTSPGYAVSDSVAAVNSTIALGVVSLVSATLRITAGSVVNTASANGTNPFDTSLGDASSTVNNLGISLFTTLLGVNTPVLGLSATEVGSTLDVQRLAQGGELTPLSRFSNLSLTVLGVPTLSLGVGATTAANFVAHDLGGLRIILNEQLAQSGQTSAAAAVNAIRISFNNFALSGRLLTGDIMVGRSYGEIQYDALISPVPEPMAWAQMLAGFSLLGTTLRRQRARSPRRVLA